MKKIAISAFRNNVSSRLDSSDEVLLFSIENGNVIHCKSIKFIPSNSLDRIHQIVELNPDVLICGGLTQFCNNKLENSSIKIIPWIKGNTEDILKQFLDGQLSEPVKTITNRDFPC